MTEVPEHLLKRAQAARERAAGPADEPAAVDAGASTAAASGDAAAESKIPAHLLERSQVGSRPCVGRSGHHDRSAGRAVGGAVAAAAPPPVASGPGGHTQRLLTVVKSGSIQDVKLKPVDKVHVWPHLLIVEFAAALAVADLHARSSRSS